LAILLVLLPPAPAHAAPLCFPEAAPAISNCIDGRFASFWQQHGGLPVFGYPLDAPHQEQASVGSITVQRFERERLELHPENAPPYDVLLGRLGAEALERQGRDWTTFPKANPGAPHYFAETGHAIAPQFWGYWSSHGLEFDGRRGTSFVESLALFGMPLSEPAMELNPTNGQPYLTTADQALERTVLPGAAPEPEPLWPYLLAPALLLLLVSVAIRRVDVPWRRRSAPPGPA